MDDEYLDPRAELERLIVDCTCEWCGETHWVQESFTGRMVTDVVRGWFCRVQKRGGYTSRHWRFWRVCRSCRAFGIGGFYKWVFPIIANIDASAALDQIIEIQPMQQPAMQHIYMDLVVGPAGAAVREPADIIPVRHYVLKNREAVHRP